MTRESSGRLSAWLNRVRRFYPSALVVSDLLAFAPAFWFALPTILGHESAGIVEEVGSDVTYVKKGDHVITWLHVGHVATHSLHDTGRLVAEDGGVFSFGVEYRGSVPDVLGLGRTLNQPIIGMTAYGDGYLQVASDGGIFVFSDEPFLGSLGGTQQDTPIAAVS